ncbi:MAG: ABC transporter substrate-binding protein [Archaeoglobaceae archaeon]|nr:ABC transporter substrate-binding protein [Archaeoglobaceae archaeon]MDW8127750.1 ABC transporter substrate-binding protein [Archaeoglobaceae archaeon]
MDSKKFLLGLGLLLVIAFLGCAEQAPTPTPTPTTPVATTPAVKTPVVTTPVVTTPPPATPTPTPVTTPKTTQVSGEPVKVCALFDPRVPVFKGNVEVIKMAVNEINSAGGIKGRKVEFYHEDTQRKVDIAVTAYRKAVLEIGCDVIFFEGVTEETLAVIEEGAKLYNTKPHIFITSTAAMEQTLFPLTNYDKYKFVFNALPVGPDHHYGWTKPFFEDAKQYMGVKKVALFIEDAAWTLCSREGCKYTTSFGTTETKAMKDWIRDDVGLEVVYVSNIAVGEKNFLPLLEMAKSRGAQYIFVRSSWYTDTVTLTKQWASSSARDIPLVLWGGPNHWSVFWNLTGGAALGVITSGAYDAQNIPPISPLTRPFIEKARSLGLSVDISSHNFYSEMYRIKESMEKVGDPKNIDAVIKAMEELEFKNHTLVPAKFAYFGYKDPRLHSYTGIPMPLPAQFQCNGQAVFISSPERIKGAGYSDEVVSMMKPEAYKPPAELRKICGS